MRYASTKPSQWSSQSARIAAVLVVLVLIFGGLFLWREFRSRGTAKAAAPAQELLQVRTTIAMARPEPVFLDAVGSIEAVQQVTIAPEVAGRVVAIFFTASTKVRKGDALVQLYDEPEQAEFASLSAKAAFTSSQLARSQELAPTGVQPRTTLEQRRSEFDQANADIKRVQALIKQKIVRAPFTGELGLRRVNLGQYLNAGDAIATLTDLNEVFANFAVPQQAIAQIQIGQQVEIRADAFPNRIFEGHVTALEPQIAGDTRNVTIQATLKNPDFSLKPGLFVQARLILPVLTDVITVPDTAVVSSANGSSVVRIAQVEASVGIVEIVPVQAGKPIGDRIMVRSGLAASDVIVTAGQVRLSPGMRVKILAEETIR